jgi:small subunit ribosomal protein S17
MANNRRRLIGRVVSDKMDKTVTVLLENRKPHPIYKKVVLESKKVHAHDESNSVETGSIVRIVESKPLSKTKRWVVEEVLAKPGEALVTELADEIALQSDLNGDTDTNAAEADEE